MTNEQYYELLKPYEDVERIISTRLEVLNRTMDRKDKSCPIHNIQSRIKKKTSIEEKLKRMGMTPGKNNARNYLKDIAGIRIICYFVSDVYDLAKALKKQSDLIVIKEKDYISQPKANGYRSYHIVLGVPVYTMDTMEYYPVEVQIRTLAMDFWASMEHRICYKKNPAGKEEARERFFLLAGEMEAIQQKIEHYNEKMMQ